MKKNLVLTIVTNYPYRKVEPFFRTLRNSGYKGDIVVFYDNLSHNTIRKIQRWNVRLIKFNSNYFKEKGIGIMHYRFRLFYNFFKKKGRDYNKVLLCDIRDIVFQKDPFDYKDYNGLNYFYENERIKDSKVNAYAFSRAANAKNALEKYGDNLISCAGTTIGDSKNILKYLYIMSENIQSEVALDQGQHNFFILTGKFSDLKGFRNLEGPVLTISDINPESLNYNSKGDLINRDGTTINIIHQYDRNSKLLRKFNKSFYYLLNFLEYKYIKFKREIKKILFNLPLVKDYFKKKFYNPVEFG